MRIRPLIALFHEDFPEIARAMARPEEAEGSCFVVSALFSRYLERRGYRAVVVVLSGLVRKTVYPQMRPCWFEMHEDLIEHYCVRVGAFVIDWSARQFDPRAAVPLVTTVAALRRRWRIVTDTE